MLKTLIVDDEKYIRDELKYFLGKIDDVELVGETGEDDEVMDLVENLNPDIVFLDIQLRAINGIVLARQILDRNNPPYIVLATAYEKYAIQGFEMNVIDYILKPFTVERIQNAIARVRQQMKLCNRGFQSFKDDMQINKLCVMRNGRLILISIEDIQYIESINNNLVVSTKTDKYCSSYSLKELEEKFQDTKLIRTHKSYIVNIDCIDEIIPWFNYTYKVTIKGGERKEIPVSRNYMKRFKNLLGI